MPHVFQAPEGDKGVYRTLLASIVIMTLAIVFMLGMVLGRFLSPSSPARNPVAGVSFADAPVIEIGLPDGMQARETFVDAERVTILAVTADGGRRVFTAPLAGLDGAVQLRLPDAPEM